MVKSEGILSEVLQAEIGTFLGPEAFSRPTSYDGVPGYHVTSVRPFSPEMLDRLTNLTNSWLSENQDRRQQGRPAISYVESITRRRKEEGRLKQQNPDQTSALQLESNDHSQRYTEPVEKSREATDLLQRKSTSRLNEFFVNGDGIRKEVLMHHTPRLLGVEASAKPSSYNGIQGYIIKAVRPFTPAMLDDLQDAILRQKTNDRYKSSPTAYSTPESQSGYPPRPTYPMARSRPSYASQASYAPEVYATQPAYSSSYSTPSSQSQYPASSTSGDPQYPGYAPVDTSRERAPYRYDYFSYGDPNEAVRKDHRPEPRLAPSVVVSGPSYGDEPIRDPYRNEAVREERLPDLRGVYKPEDPYRHDLIREERRRRQ